MPHPSIPTSLPNFAIVDTSKLRRIIHIDMDAFFAAVEQRDNPKLQGLPIAVGHDVPRGVVATASYEARRFGVHSALSITRAKQLCPRLLIVEPHFDRYKEVSRQIRSIFEQYTSLIEPLSIDEAFLDVTTNKKGIPLAQDIARLIKQQILEETGLTASAGVSYNKLLAKIASDLRKPDGLCTIHPLRAQQFLASLPIEQFWGVGPRTAQKMHSLGVTNGAELKALPLSRLLQSFGKMGRVFYDFARGIDLRPVHERELRKSVSCENTFDSDLTTLPQVDAQIDLLIDNLVGRIRRNHFEGRTLTLKVKFSDFTLITRSTTAPEPLVQAEQITPLCRQLSANLRPSARPIRLLGVGISINASQAASQPPEFEFYHLRQLEFAFTDKW